LATSTIQSSDVVFMLGMIAIPLWVIFFGLIFNSTKWFK